MKIHCKTESRRQDDFSCLRLRSRRSRSSLKQKKVRWRQRDTEAHRTYLSQESNPWRHRAERLCSAKKTRGSAPPEWRHRNFDHRTKTREKKKRNSFGNGGEKGKRLCWPTLSQRSTSSPIEEGTQQEKGVDAAVEKGPGSQSKKESVRARGKTLNPYPDGGTAQNKK